MTETAKSKPHLVDSDLAGAEPAEKLNIFSDLEKLRHDSEVTVHKREVVTTIAVVKPSPTAYFRTPADDGMTLRAGIFRYEEGKQRADLFVVPAMRDHPRLAERIKPVLLTPIYLWPRRTLGIWPVGLDMSNRWHKSAFEVYKLAKTRWMQMAAGNDQYLVWDAEGRDMPAPDFDSMGFGEMLKIAFDGLMIDSEDCPWMLTIRGIK